LEGATDELQHNNTRVQLAEQLVADFPEVTLSRLLQAVEERARASLIEEFGGLQQENPHLGESWEQHKQRWADANVAKRHRKLPGQKLSACPVTLRRPQLRGARTLLDHRLRGGPERERSRGASSPMPYQHRTLVLVLVRVHGNSPELPLNCRV
jgi:hypothetical protein